MTCVERQVERGPLRPHHCPATMFKKRTRPASVREKPAVVEEPKAEGEDGDEVEEAGDEESG